jgi:hypothetical protein
VRVQLDSPSLMVRVPWKRAYAIVQCRLGSQQYSGSSASVRQVEVWRCVTTLSCAGGVQSGADTSGWPDTR